MDTDQGRSGLFGHLTQRARAEQYMLLSVLSFAASVSGTRLLLTVTNYPQIGGGQLHIAHVLWGGLLLYAAALLPLLFANRAVYNWGALMAGTGVGLFIDEVGKFITQQNDYFYPIAASIIYVLFLLSIALFLQVRRAAHARGRDQLTQLFEEIYEIQPGSLSPARFARLKERLEAARTGAPTEPHAALAGALLAFLQGDVASSAAPISQTRRLQDAMGRVLSRLASGRWLRRLLIFGLAAMGLLSLKNPVTVLLSPVLPPDVIAFLGNLRLGRQVVGVAPAFWGWLRLGLEVAVGLLLIAGAALIGFRRKRVGADFAYFGLLLSLSTVDILLFYFEQFSTIITVAVQFLLLLGVLAYRREAGDSDP
jgi:hypothetical protein